MGILDEGNGGGGDVLFRPHDDSRTSEGGGGEIVAAPPPAPLGRFVVSPLRRSAAVTLGHTRQILGHSPLASGAFLAVLILAVVASNTSSALARSVDTSSSAAAEATVCTTAAAAGTSDDGLTSAADDESESFKLSVAAGATATATDTAAAVPTNDGVEADRADEVPAADGADGAGGVTPLDGEDAADVFHDTAEVVDEDDDDVVARSPTFGASRPGDGSETDPDGLPARFVRMQKGNRPKAIKAFQHTVEWRSDRDVDTILYRPHPKFDRVKAIFPHYFAGRDAVGNPVLVQRFGSIDLDYAATNDVSEDEIRMHYVYVLEYCWNVWEPKSEDGVEGVMTSILDMDGVSWRMLQKPHVMGFVRSVVGMTSAHYPQRSYKTLIINAPRWFQGVYRLIKPLLRESTRAKISIHSSGAGQDEALREVLGEGGVPRELLSDGRGGGGVVADDGGESEGVEGDVDGSDGEGEILYVSAAAEPGPNSQIELELRAFVSVYAIRGTRSFVLGIR